MIRSLLLVGTCLACAMGSASAAETDQSAGTPGPTPTVAEWPAPLRLPIELPTPDATGQKTELSIVPGQGLVKGTPDALSSIGHPLPAADGTNRTLEACKQAVWARARQAGGEAIDAASDGVDKTTRDGRVFAPVTIRLAYLGTLTHEVRKSSVICVTDDDGNFLDAYTPERTSREAAPTPAR